MRKRSQAELVPLLKVYIDMAMDGDKAAHRHVTRLLTGQNIGTKYVTHNIGKKRYAWLVEFLQKK